MVDDYFLEVITRVEERLFDLREGLAWFFLCFKKFYSNLWKYFHGTEDRL